MIARLSVVKCDRAIIGQFEHTGEFYLLPEIRTRQCRFPTINQALPSPMIARLSVVKCDRNFYQYR
ncbi:MAG: hypothetical protein LH628_02625 [Microcoleus sp. CAN_BIN18]|nr:hypothetical protein [Microcoleus sp. CAN_BIN18]